MQYHCYFSFDGKSKEAIEFYKSVFNAKVVNMLTFGQAPANPNFAVKEQDKDRICHAELIIGEQRVMFCDCTSDGSVTMGDNIMLAVTSKDIKEIKNIFSAISLGGEILMPFGETFFSPGFGMVKDKFGIKWQLSTIKG